MIQPFHKNLTIGETKSIRLIFLYTHNKKKYNDNVGFKVIFARETFIKTTQVKVTRNMSQDTCILTHNVYILF